MRTGRTSQEVGGVCITVLVKGLFYYYGTEAQHVEYLYMVCTYEVLDCIVMNLIMTSFYMKQ